MLSEFELERGWRRCVGHVFLVQILEKHVLGFIWRRRYDRIRTIDRILISITHACKRCLVGVDLTVSVKLAMILGAAELVDRDGVIDFDVTEGLFFVEKVLL